MDNERVLELETSLRNFFFDFAEVGQGQSAYAGRMKYRGLSLKIDDSQKEEPAFKVGIGTFEATFRISDGLKINGSLAGDEKIVMKWFYRGYNQQLLLELVGKVKSDKIEMVNTNYVDTGLNIDSKKS